MCELGACTQLALSLAISGIIHDMPDPAGEPEARSSCLRIESLYELGEPDFPNLCGKDRC